MTTMTLTAPSTSTTPALAYGWHFVGEEHALPAGTTERIAPPLVVGQRGLHGSRLALDALPCVPRTVDHPQVRWCAFGGEVKEGRVEFVATERRILWTADATATFYAYARWCVAQPGAGAMATRWAAHPEPSRAALGAALCAMGGPQIFFKRDAGCCDEQELEAYARFNARLERLLRYLAPPTYQHAHHRSIERTRP